jgi:membrane protease subunit HflK
MERVLGNTDKIIIDDKAGGTGVVPYLPLDQLNRTAPRPGSTTGSTGGAQ